MAQCPLVNAPLIFWVVGKVDFKVSGIICKARSLRRKSCCQFSEVGIFAE